MRWPVARSRSLQRRATPSPEVLRYALGAVALGTGRTKWKACSSDPEFRRIAGRSVETVLMSGGNGNRERECAPFMDAGDGIAYSVAYELVPQHASFAAHVAGYVRVANLDRRCRTACAQMHRQRAAPILGSRSSPPKVHPPGKGAPSPQLERVAARSSRAGSGVTSRCGRDGSPCALSGPLSSDERVQTLPATALAGGPPGCGGTEAGGDNLRRVGVTRRVRREPAPTHRHSERAAHEGVDRGDPGGGEALVGLEVPVELVEQSGVESP